MSTRNLTIMFTDIKGFTERTARSSRDYVVKMLEQQDKLLKPIISKYNGIVIKSIGDAYLVTFESPTNAVICGLMMQHALRSYNRAAHAEERIEVRVAINTGEVNMVGDDVLGDPVNVASRVEGITEANEVWFTEATYLSMNKQEVPTSEVGEFKLKGVPEAVRIYRASVDETQILYRKHFDDAGKSREAHGELVIAPPKKAPVALIAAILVLVIGAVVVMRSLGPSSAYAQADELLKEKKYPQALQLLETKLAATPTDLELQTRARQAVEGEIAGMIERGEVADARQRVELYRGRHTFLGAMSPLMRDIRIAEVAQRAKTRRDVSADIEKLLQDYPDDATAWYFTAALLYKQGEWGLRTAMPKFKRALDLDSKGYARKPEVIDAFGKAIEMLTVYELFERADFSTIIVANYFEDLRPKIYEGIKDEKNPERRFICYRLITAKNELSKIDPVAFNLLNLNDEKLTSSQEKQTLEFFEGLLPRAADAELRKKFPAKMSFYPALLSSDEKISAQALAVARGLFREPLAEAAEAARKGGDEKKRAVAEAILSK